jgi:hypothetical protein
VCVCVYWCMCVFRPCSFLRDPAFVFSEIARLLLLAEKSGRLLPLAEMSEIYRSGQVGGSRQGKGEQVWFGQERKRLSRVGGGWKTKGERW